MPPKAPPIPAINAALPTGPFNFRTVFKTFLRLFLLPINFLTFLGISLTLGYFTSLAKEAAAGNAPTVLQSVVSAAALVFLALGARLKATPASQGPGTNVRETALTAPTVAISRRRFKRSSLDCFDTFVNPNSFNISFSSSVRKLLVAYLSG